MNIRNVKTGLLIVFGFCLFNLNAQETPLPSGGEANGTGGSVSYSIGQLVYSMNTGANGSLVQGVQQPYEISVVSGIMQTKGINLECVVYPNPATDYLILSIENTSSVSMTYQLYDTDGRMITKDKIIASKTEIKTDNLTQGNYLLRVINNVQVIKTFKIIKR